MSTSDRRGDEHPESGDVGPERVGDDERGRARDRVGDGAEAHDPAVGHDGDEPTPPATSRRPPPGGTGSGRPRERPPPPPRSAPPPAAASSDRAPPPARAPPTRRARAPASPRRPGWRAAWQRRAPRRPTIRWSRRRAASAASPTASPRAKVRRPTATLTTVPAANSSLAATARRRCRVARRATGSRSAATTQLATATVAAPSAGGEDGEQHAVPRGVVPGEPQVAPDRGPPRSTSVDAQQLRRPVGPAPPQGCGESRQQPCNGRRQQVAASHSGRRHRPMSFTTSEVLIVRINGGRWSCGSGRRLRRPVRSPWRC